MVIGENAQRAGRKLLGFGKAAGGQVQVGHLSEKPGAVFEFLIRSGIVCPLHQVDGSFDVAVQFAQIGGAGKARNVARAQIEHPLDRVNGLLVITELGVRVSQVAVDGDVIGCLAIELACDLAGLAKFVAAQQQPRPDLETFVVVGSHGEGLFQRLFRLAIERDVGSLARAARIGHRESVVGWAVIRPFGNLFLRFTDGGFSRRGGKGRQHRKQGGNHSFFHIRSPYVVELAGRTNSDCPANVIGF